MKAWILAARPKTLSASVVPVLVGTALAHSVNWIAFGCALGGAVFIQVGTNLVNDALDFKRGADTSTRLGPLRVTQAGLLSARTVLIGAIVCFIIAALFGIPLLIRAGWPLAVIGLTSIVAAYAYTGGSYYVQRLQIDRNVLLAGFAVGCLAVALLAINNLRDIGNDRASNKRTLAVRFGENFGRLEIVICVLVPFLAIAPITWVPVVALPLAWVVLRCVQRAKGAELNRCLAMAGALQWAFGILFVIGMAL